jgi:hypothetical protein
MKEPGNRTTFSVGDVIRGWGAEYSRTHPVPAHQRSVMRLLAACRTSALGGHLEKCDACGFERPVYNSCGDRHCPTCQGKLARKWLAARLDDLLNTHYFHCVFTIPDTFNALVPHNETTVYNARLKAASETLKHFARTELHGQLGMIAVLHTWGQTLWLHPHAHFVVTGGALSSDLKQWHSTGPDFLFDVFDLSRGFRKRFCRILRRAKLVFQGDAVVYADRSRFEAFLDEQAAREWVVFTKKPFAGPRQVLEYIGRYTHRVAISNRRIVDVSEDGAVTFTYRDYRLADADGLAPEKEMSVSAPEFIGRFLRHVLPKGFRKLRSYGILAGANKSAKIAAVRDLLGPTALPEDLNDPADSATEDLIRCPECGTGTMRPGVALPCERPPPVVLPWIRPITFEAA